MHRSGGVVNLIVLEMGAALRAVLGPPSELLEAGARVSPRIAYKQGEYNSSYIVMQKGIIK